MGPAVKKPEANLDTMPANRAICMHMAAAVCKVSKLCANVLQEAGSWGMIQSLLPGFHACVVPHLPHMRWRPQLCCHVACSSMAAACSAASAPPPQRLRLLLRTLRGHLAPAALAPALAVLLLQLPPLPPLPPPQRRPLRWPARATAVGLPVPRLLRLTALSLP